MPVWEKLVEWWGGESEAVTQKLWSLCLGQLRCPAVGGGEGVPARRGMVTEPERTHLFSVETLFLGCLSGISLDSERLR